MRETHGKIRMSVSIGPSDWAWLREQGIEVACALAYGVRALRQEREPQSLLKVVLAEREKLDTEIKRLEARIVWTTETNRQEAILDELIASSIKAAPRCASPSKQACLMIMGWLREHESDLPRLISRYPTMDLLEPRCVSGWRRLYPAIAPQILADEMRKAQPMPKERSSGNMGGT